MEHTTVTELAAGSEIRTARQALGWSQAQLAEAAGVTRGTVVAIEGLAAERLACALRPALREKVAASLDGDEPDAAALAALRGLKRVSS